jgi:hypothetical protein
MLGMRPNLAVVLLLASAALSGCGGQGTFGSATSSSGSGEVVLAMTDTPAANIAILSAQVTLTGATLNPGNVSLLPAPVAIELTRLQTDVAYLSTTSANADTYTSLTLTFSNSVKLTFENDTGSAISGAACTGVICTMAPVPTNLSTTITLPTLTVSAGNATGLLLDVNLNTLLSTTLGVDFQSGTSVSQFTPTGTGAPPVGAEDVVGQVISIDTVHSAFSFQNATATYSLAVDNTSAFFQFPSNLCTTAGLTCLRDGQILSVDIGIRSDGTPLARNLLFEDGDSSETEVEGVITGINSGTLQFNMVTLAESAAVSGLSIGDPATVHYAVSTPFDVDFTHADNLQVDTSCCVSLFTAATDLAVGQQVQVRRTSGSSGTSLTAARVRLRSSRVTGVIQSLAAPVINLGGSSPNFPSLFITNGITQIQVQTFSPSPTIFTGTTTTGIAVNNITELFVNNIVSVRGPLFNVSGARTLVATKVVLKQ